MPSQKSLLLDPISKRLLAWSESLRAIATLPLAWSYRLSSERPVVEADCKQWLTVLGCDDGVHGLHSLLYAFAEFRALFYYRLSQGNPTGALLARALAHIYRATPGLGLATPHIGPGLFIAHGYGTTLAAASIGSNCYVHQGVTVGWDYRSTRAPVIGDGVFIGAGAKVLGAITVGDGARIGANAVVLCDVPAGATAVGMPARIVSAEFRADSVPGKRYAMKVE